MQYLKIATVGFAHVAAVVRCMPYSVKPHQPFIMARLDLPEMLFDLFGTEVHKV